MLKRFYNTLLILMLLTIGTAFSQTFNWTNLKTEYLINNSMNFNYFIETEGNFHFELWQNTSPDTLIATFSVQGLRNDMINYIPKDIGTGYYFILKNYNKTIIIGNSKDEGYTFDFVYGNVRVTTPNTSSPLNYQHRFIVSIETENKNLPIDLYFRFHNTGLGKIYKTTYIGDTTYIGEFLLDKFCNKLSVYAQFSGTDIILDDVLNIPVGHDGIDSIIQKLRDEYLDLQAELDSCGDSKLRLLDSIRILNETIVELYNVIESKDLLINILNKQSDLLENVNSELENQIKNLQKEIERLQKELHITIIDIPMSVKNIYSENNIVDGGIVHNGKKFEFPIYQNYYMFDILGNHITSGDGNEFIFGNLNAGIYFLYLREAQVLYKFVFEK